MAHDKIFHLIISNLPYWTNSRLFPFHGVLFKDGNIGKAKFMMTHFLVSLNMLYAVVPLSPRHAYHCPHVISVLARAHIMQHQTWILPENVSSAFSIPRMSPTQVRRRSKCWLEIVETFLAEAAWPAEPRRLVATSRCRRGLSDLQGFDGAAL